MTFSTLALALIWKRLRLRDRIVVSSVVYPEGGTNLYAVIRAVVGMTLAIETIGALLLAWRWLTDSVAEALGAGVFHSVYAFCNAGFALFSDSLYCLRGDATAILAVMTLFVLGGLGFPVILELSHYLRPWHDRRRQALSLHAKVVFAVTGVLLLLGLTAVYLLEANHTLADLSRSEQLLAASF
jgi:trk system potassium uptake protein TrkH